MFSEILDISFFLILPIFQVKIAISLLSRFLYMLVRLNACSHNLNHFESPSMNCVDLVFHHLRICFLQCSCWFSGVFCIFWMLSSCQILIWQIIFSQSASHLLALTMMFIKQKFNFYVIASVFLIMDCDYGVFLRKLFSSPKETKITLLQFVLFYNLTFLTSIFNPFGI